MSIAPSGTIRLFRFAGVDVFLHWTWFLLAVYEINQRGQMYSSILWNALEYLALFGIVLLHEFGHALACRQVGGQADRILLWPLGGVAIVDPPQRPGATLWSIAAGPLVNVALIPVLLACDGLLRLQGAADAWPNALVWLRAVAFINLGLLIFNLLPIYPLDGGQIFRALLWFPFGRARSLMIATVIGFLGVGALGLLALARQSVWIGVLAAFILLNCWQGLRQALLLARLAKAPRRVGWACPSCGAAPLIGAHWRCGRCRTAFDTFDTQAQCPRCGAAFDVTRCPDCNRPHPLSAWATPPPVPRHPEAG